MPIAYISHAARDSERHWTPLDLEAGSIVWAIKRLRGYLWGKKVLHLLGSQGARNVETTIRESSGGSSFTPRSTTPSSTVRAAPAEMPIFCPVCQSLPRNTMTVNLTASPPWKMAVSSSSIPGGFVPVPLRTPVLA